MKEMTQKIVTEHTYQDGFVRIPQIIRFGLQPAVGGSKDIDAVRAITGSSRDASGFVVSTIFVALVAILFETDTTIFVMRTIISMTDTIVFEPWKEADKSARKAAGPPKTIFSVRETIVSKPEMIVSGAETCIAGPDTTVSATGTFTPSTNVIISIVKTLISAMEGSFFVADAIISATDTIFSATETCFFVVEKSAGAAPAVRSKQPNPQTNKRRYNHGSTNPNFTRVQ